MSEKYKYLLVEGTESMVQMFKTAFEEFGLPCRKITRDGNDLGFLEPGQIITLLVTLLGSGGVITTILANKKRNKIKVTFNEGDAIIEIECTDINANEIKNIIQEIKDALIGGSEKPQ